MANGVGQVADVRTMKLNLLADVAQFGRSLTKADKHTKSFSSNVGKYSKAMAKSFALAGVAAAGFAVKIGLDAVQAASDLNEEVSKTEVIFGDVSKDIKAFAKTADMALGLSQKEALAAASTFATFGKAAGLTGQPLAKFSKSATTLASDLASFYNTNADEAITAIGAALRGESEPIRRFGVLLNDSTLKAKAMEMGLYSGKGALDLQAKSLAAYEVILDQTTDAQGDFARTSDGLAGQQKILAAQMENLKTSLGTSLLPTMLDVVTAANKVARAFSGEDPDGLSLRARELKGEVGDGGAGSLGRSLKILADAFAELFKAFVDDGDEATDGMQEVADALIAVAKGVNAVTSAYRKAKDLKLLGLFSAFDIVTNGVPNPDTPGKAAGGFVKAGQAYRVGEFGPETFIASNSGFVQKASASGGGTTVINLNGIVDAASARRSIERLLQTQSRISGPINLAGAMP